MTFLSVLLLAVLSAARPDAGPGRRPDAFGLRLVRARCDLGTAAEYRDAAIETLECCRVRLDARAEQIPDIIARARDGGLRVDTIRRARFPDLTPTAVAAVP